MITSEPMSQAEDPDVPEARPNIVDRRWHRWELVVTVLVVVAAVVRMPLRWTPLGDNALMRMWTDAVGTRNTPLVGGDARYGWNHLGPWLFYLLAIPYRLLGRSAVGLLAGAAAINVISVVLVMRCVRAVAGERAAAVVTGGALLFLVTAQGDRLVDPWNPYVVQLPFLVALVCCWAVLNRRHEWLALLVGAGSLCVQGHITFIVPVSLLIAMAAASTFRARRALSFVHVKRALIVAVVAWLPAAVDLVLPRHHNLYHVVRFFITPTTDRTGGFDASTKILLRETGLRASWLGGHLGLRVFTEGFDGGIGLLPGTGLVFLVVAALLAWRRHDRVLGGLVAIITVLLPAAVLEMTLGRGELYPYLFGWVSLVGMMCWAALAIAVVRSPSLSGRAAHHTTRVLGSTVVATASVLVIVGIGALPPRSPRERRGDAAIVRQLVADSEPQLTRGARYQLIHGNDIYSSIYELGVVDELRHDGYNVTAPPNAVVLFGRHMIDQHWGTYPRLSIVAPFEHADPAWRVLASSDPLNPNERAEEATLVDSLLAEYASTGETDGDATRIVKFAEGDLVVVAGFIHPDPLAQPMLQRLATLRTQGRSIAVVLAPNK